MSESSEVPDTLRIGPTAGCVHYSFGVACFLEDNYSIPEDLVYETVSGGNYIAASMIHSNARHGWDMFSLRSCDLASRTNPWEYVSQMYNLVQDHCEDFIRSTRKFHPNKRNHKVAVCLGTLGYLGRVWPDSFHSIQDYANCLVGGSFIPYLTSMCAHGWHWRGKKVCDGAFRIYFDRALVATFVILCCSVVRARVLLSACAWLASALALRRAILWFRKWCTDNPVGRHCDKPADRASRTVSIEVEGPDVRWWWRLYGVWGDRANHETQFRAGYRWAEENMPLRVAETTAWKTRNRTSARDTIEHNQPLLPDLALRLVRWNAQERSFSAVD